MAKEFNVMPLVLVKLIGGEGVLVPWQQTQDESVACKKNYDSRRHLKNLFVE